MANQPLLLLVVAATALFVGCSESDTDKFIRFDDELGRRYAGGEIRRLVDLGQTIPDQSCLDQGRTWIRGEATDREIQDLAAMARARWPDEAIRMIELSPRVAMVKTGIDCAELPGNGFGHRIYFELDNDRDKPHWQFALESSWIG